MLYFDSDYMCGAHPEVLDALVRTNSEQTVGYGLDKHSENAKRLIREACSSPDADVWLLVGGTQTNATVIDALLRPHEGVIAVETGHINVHESGAIEASGHKVLTLPQHNGKVDAEELRQYLTNFYADDTWQHMVVPGMLYISFPTECGSIYTLKELQDLRAVCDEFIIKLYLDGARIGYGLAAHGCDFTLRDIAQLCDVFYIGGTKEGLMFGEAVVAKNGLLPYFFTIIKQHGALLAKGRMLGVQFEALFSNNLFSRIASHAVDLAMKLREGFIAKGYSTAFDSPTNQQFFTLPNDVIDRLREYASFENWGPRGETETTVRFVTSWATTTDDVANLCELL